MDNSSKPRQPNPQSFAWFGSQLYFIWIVPLLWNGSNNGLSDANLTECLPVDKSSELGDRLEREWNRQKAHSATRSPKLKSALFRTFSSLIVPQGVLFFVAIISKSCMPIVLSQLLILFQRKSPITSQINGHESSLYVEDIWTDPSIQFIVNAWHNKAAVGALMGIITLISSICYHHAEMNQRMLGAKVRIACCSLIFRKTLRLSKLAASQTSAGYLINLLSNDVNRFDLGFIHTHYLWILPIQTTLITYLIYNQIGWAALVGVAALLVQTMPVQTTLSCVLSRIRLRVALKTDERVGIMHEIVQGIQVIKMYAWEPFFRSTVLNARQHELQQVHYASYIRGFNLFASISTERTTLFLTIIACTLLGQPTTADIVFSLAQYYNVLQLTVAILYPLAVALGGEALVSIKRVEEFLLLEERETSVCGGLLNDADSVPIRNKLKENANAFELIEVSAVWDSIFAEHTLKDITLNVKAGSLCAVVGPVGAGKSSLLHLLLGELPLKSGSMSMTEKASVSYASQEPWLFSGTVRNNILFGESFDEERYTKVVSCCSLVRDFKMFPKGDQTMVGERGASLSGGQRARIGLARAVYKKATIYLLDDPLSAVDSHVGRQLYENVIGSNGCLAQMNATRILVTHQVHLLQGSDNIIIIDLGRIVGQGSYTELASKKTLHFLDYEELCKDKTDSENKEDLGQRLIQNFPNSENDRDSFLASNSTKKNEKLVQAEDLEKEHKSTEGEARVWMQYLRSGSSVWKLLWLLAIMLISQVVISRADFYLTYWTEREDLRFIGNLNEKSRFMDLVVYGILLLLVICFVLLRSVLFFDMCIRTSEALHMRMLSSLLGAQMRVFDINPSGRILNRFSKDLGTMDETMPCAIAESIQTLLLIIGILCVVIILNPAMLIALAFSVLFVVLLLKLYLRAAQDLKRLEGITRSPVFSQMSATIDGISTIRSCGIESVLVREFDGLQDVHSAVWRQSMAANTALGLWLDTLSVFFVICVTYSFIYAFDDISSGNVGMALSQAIILINYVQFGIRQTTISLQHLVNVERSLEYTRLDQEVQTDADEPVADWPQFGEIRFSKMCLRYHPDTHPILSDFNLEIQAGWKVGIVGRTGAGKSSLIAALFRLAIIDGSISIDSIDTSSISLKCLRSRISIIPQDPVLFSATIRSNLDPFNKFTDDELWQAIQAVELKSSIPMLDSMVCKAGSNFSIGQRQLICLARAILRKDRILVLDEATANVDPKTDALIQRTIRERFVNSTVLTVAHRLRTVMDSDRIVVMDGGRIVEFDEPHVLLEKPNGALRHMVSTTGQLEAESLRQFAESAYLDRNSTDL